MGDARLRVSGWVVVVLAVGGCGSGCCCCCRCRCRCRCCCCCCYWRLIWWGFSPQAGGGGCNPAPPACPPHLALKTAASFSLPLPPPSPACRYHDGHLTTHFNSSHYRLCEKRYPELAGQLSDLQLEALQLFEEIASDPSFAVGYLLQPGDIILLHNSSVLHARSAFKDGEEPHERRHLVRLWLGCEDDRPPPKHLAFPRSYTEGSDKETFEGLMKPRPSKFHVPLSEEADDV